MILVYIIKFDYIYEIVDLDKKENEKKEIDKDKDKGDKIVENYDAVIRESSLLTTVAGILFGFLLNISVNPPSKFTDIDKVFLIASLFSIVISTLLFSMPVIYHHMQYPYHRFDKFKERSHKFLVFGIIPFFLTLYLCLSLAIFIFLDFPNTIRDISIKYGYSLLLSSIPFVIVYILYRKRK